ncbi:UNVERIFIED_CONTAM: hypothetical protein K2H54_002650 [Gekko kuhli]
MSDGDEGDEEDAADTGQPQGLPQGALVQPGWQPTAAEEPEFREASSGCRGGECSKKSGAGSPGSHHDPSPQNRGGQPPGGRGGGDKRRACGGGAGPEGCGEGRVAGAAGAGAGGAEGAGGGGDRPPGSGAHDGGPAPEAGANGRQDTTPVQRWRATLCQSGIEELLWGIMEAVSRERPPPWQTALRVLAFLVSRIDVRDPGNRAGPREGGLWAQLTGLKSPLQEAWAGLCSDVGAQCALALEITEHLLGSEESCSRAGETPAWVSLSSVTVMLWDIEQQLGCVSRQEEEDVAGRAGAGAGAAAAATARRAWEATMSLSGFRHVGQLLEAGRRERQPDWELSLRVWGYLVAHINEYLWATPAPLPPDEHLWEHLTTLRGPIHATWADRRHGSEWERHLVLNIVARLNTDGAARQGAGPPPPWLTIGALAGTLEDIFNDLQRAEGQERTTVMALHAHLLKEKAAGRDRKSPPPDPAEPARAVEGTSAQLQLSSSNEATSGASDGGSDAANLDDGDADAMEGDDEDGRRRREWRAVLRQAGIREPVLGLLRVAEAEGWPEAEVALKIWAFLMSRVNAPMDERDTVLTPTLCRVRRL